MTLTQLFELESGETVGQTDVLFLVTKRRGTNDVFGTLKSG
jgi:hypothetical protein